MIFPSRVNGIPCQVQITHFSPFIPAKTWGPPETCYEAEGGELEFSLLDRRGRHAAWLERYISPEVEAQIAEEYKVMRMAELYAGYPEPEF